jgi:hypothetical protein
MYGHPPFRTTRAGRAIPIQAAMIGTLIGWLRRWASSRAFALLLVLGAPGVSDIVRDVVAGATGAECCSDGVCDERLAMGCADACSHCTCCAQARAVLGAFELLELAGPTGQHMRIVEPENRRASGFRAPPFRPPAA